MFLDRADAARQLAEELKNLELHDPLVLGIPRGGVVTADVLARALGAEMDVVLSRKIGAPQQPELAVGAVGEDGEVYLNHQVEQVTGVSEQYLERERQRQMQEIARRQKLFRAARPRAPMEGRSVILTDDGIATGSTMIAAIGAVKAQHPREVIVAVPVAPPDRLPNIRRLCDRLVCLLAPPHFWAVGQFYRSFAPVEDDEVVRILKKAAPAQQAAE